ncbi:MAG TPA: hypothetical protein VFN07_11750 [Trueperaceae bacterium]|nr:hypothetical protein [Trueperaceae bacterium]HRP46826.1 hypothetical protein [Trueperaceae bacterium]
MRNITVTVDEETYRRARVKAAELDTSVSRLVRDYLIELAADDSEFEHLERLEAEQRGRVVDFSAKDRLTRDQVHERHA